MEKRESVIVDKIIYTRVLSTQQTVNKLIADKLAVALEKVVFEYEDLPKTSCCKQMKVTGIYEYAEVINKRAAKNILDDKADTV